LIVRSISAHGYDGVTISVAAAKYRQRAQA
jgi:hypothetical protein